MACIANINEKNLEPHMVCNPEAVDEHEAFFCQDYVQTVYTNNYLKNASVIFCKKKGLYLIGGLFDGEPCNFVFRLKQYDDHLRWHLFEKGLNVPRVFHSAILVEDTIYVSGGQNLRRAALKSLECAELSREKESGLKWHLMHCDLNVPRYDHCMIISAYELHVLGGKDAHKNYLKSVERVSDEGFFPAWEICDSEMESPRAEFSASCRLHYVIMIGGKSDDHTEIDTISMLDLITIETTHIATIPEELYSIVAGFGVGDNYIYIVGRASTSRNQPSVSGLAYGLESQSIEESDITQSKNVEVSWKDTKEGKLSAAELSGTKRPMELESEKPKSSSSSKTTAESVSEIQDKSQKLPVSASQEKPWSLRRRASSIVASAATWASRKISRRKSLHAPSTTKTEELFLEGETEKRKSTKHTMGESEDVRKSDPRLHSKAHRGSESDEDQSHDPSTSKEFAKREQDYGATSDDGDKPSSSRRSGSEKETRVHRKKEFLQRKAPSTSAVPEESKTGFMTWKEFVGESEDTTTEEKETKLVTSKEFLGKSEDRQAHDLVVRYDLERGEWSPGFCVPYYGHSERWSLVCLEKPSM